MLEGLNLSWSLQTDRTCCVRSPWWELVWHPSRGLTQLCFGVTDQRNASLLFPSDGRGSTASPAVAAGAIAAWKVPAILGLDSLRIRDRCWRLNDFPPQEIVIQENRITASWPPRNDCPVELHARWVLEGCRFWLEASLLTPGQVEKVSLDTVSDLGTCTALETPDLHSTVRAALLRPQAGSDWSYLELARSEETTRVQVSPPGTISFRLFDTTLEKGVVLRARLLATFLSRQHETSLARDIAQQFVVTPPNLSR